jgi:hypothetical protein
MPRIQPPETARPAAPHEAPQEAPAWLVETLAESMAQVEAGNIVPLEPVLDELRASIARMEAKAAGSSR